MAFKYPAYAPGSASTAAAIAPKSTVPKTLYARKIANRNPKSPMRLTTNAFLPAAAHQSWVKE